MDRRRETYAIGGGCQLLLTSTTSSPSRHCRCTLPARNEGIIPGAANLRLPRFVGDRARPPGDPLRPRVCEPEDAGRRDRRARGDGRGDRAPRADLTSAGAVSGVANRRALRIGQEPLDIFREYMAAYAREQAVCHFSPALIRNLEENWRAHERRVETRRAPCWRRSSSSACGDGRARAQPRGARGPCRDRSLDDLEQLPFTVKDDLREHYPLGLLAVPPSGCAASTPPAAPAASRRSSATRETTSTSGRR